MSAEFVFALPFLVATALIVWGVMRSVRRPPAPERLPSPPFEVGTQVFLPGYDDKPHEVLALRYVERGDLWEAFVRIENVCIWKRCEDLAVWKPRTVVDDREVIVPLPRKIYVHVGGHDVEIDDVPMPDVMPPYEAPK